MKKTTRKIIWTFLIAVLYLIAIIVNLFSNKISNETVKHVCYIVPLTWTLIVYVYNHWNILFVPVNRIHAIITGTTSSFQLSYRFSLNDAVFRKDYIKIYDELARIYKIDHKEESDDYKLIEFESMGLKLRLNFRINPANQDSYDNLIDQIVVILDASVSYRDSQKIIDNFFSIIDLIDKRTGEIVDEAQLDNVAGIEINYQCIIRLSKYNPFYRYQIKHISTKEFPKFKQMELQDSETKILITTDKMVINTPNKDYLKEIVKEYIPISNIG